jgi:peptide/nickel transport system ATP-binding protein/oligopeptide transport system ATP-binding protein
VSVAADKNQPLLELRGLRTYFHTEEGTSRAVDGVDFVVNKGETLGVVGESGCGKSVTALSVMRLVPDPPGEIVAGEILLEGDDLLQRSEDDMRWVRGNEIAMIFQEPMTALNPVFTVGDQIGEAVRLHKGASKKEARARAIEMLDLVGIPSAAERIDEYPHQLSGGMRQRVMIAMAMSCEPKLLIADEPTTALDVTIQAQILDLIRDLQEREGMSVLLITHDLGVIAETAHHVAVMYAGKIVEYTTAARLFAAPKHPYTIGLFRSLPELAQPGERLETIPGIVPAPNQFPSGCRFRTRCPLATERCAEEEPALASAEEGHTVACHHLEEAQKL